MSAPPQTVSIEVGLDEPDDEESLRARVAKAAGVELSALPPIQLLKRSIDARRGRVRLLLTVAIGREAPAELGLPHPRPVESGRRVVIVGDGPAGLFCAYQLARGGIASVIVERGKQVQPRRRDLKGLNQRGEVDADSNYCFGEGGAGTYSDGKLYTRSHKRGDIRDVIEILALHGAPERVLTDARPHIGSNKLPVVISGMRERLIACGVEFRFGARAVGLECDSAGRAAGVRLADGDLVTGDAVVVATGHSARDVWDWLAEAGVELEAKPFALGVRIEHPQPLIDRIQYGRVAGHPKLGAAAYRLSRQVDGRGVFSFCMCPGGWIVPAATEPGGVVVNGMSLSRRDSPFANSGLVVAIEADDLAAAGYRGALAGVELQRRIEGAAFDAGGGQLRAPATRVSDFVARRPSTTVAETSYIPGLAAGDIAAVVDAGGVAIAARLRTALEAFGRNLRGYVTDQANLIGVESRTSSPVRVPRDPGTLQSPDVSRLYPCGEGAGYAGGIVSAALDGFRVARAMAGND